MFKDRDEYINNLGREPSFEERRVIYWAFRYIDQDKLEEYLATKVAGKEEKKEKIMKVKNNKDEVTI